ncbi:structure-specific endonuclease subunit slx1 isoform X1 [Ananas comosus]|uniref:Structure-specific endonuclease subunit slx1 isoform X1 n=1 Tax=Ananas comosus TaxID=4615 RepID=A0A6P5FTH1_ANACO|nr:structure-specific endonuclease subunit slx1 isoform X1 [Ananas comosus]
MRKQLSTRFRSTKPASHRLPPKALSPTAVASSPSSSSSSSSLTPGRGGRRSRCPKSEWCVYLILSSRLNRSYVGVTTNFVRRLKQHNGEIKGGAKAASAGRPWSLACIIRGFVDRSEACRFESLWKSISRKMSRKKKEENAVNPVLQHREAALNRVKTEFDCSCLGIEWQSPALN